ncbi:MAG TPA: methyl-accepting chemotaxis protein [Bacillota bacterium]|nr:methyl-accepting chemotaxis protein [Bacillota bacterium]
MELALTGQADDLASFLATRDNSYLEAYKTGNKEFKHWNAVIRKLDLSGQETGLLDEVEELYDQYSKQADLVIALAKDGKLAEANKKAQEVLGKIEDQIFENLTIIEGDNTNLITEKGKSADVLIDRSIFLGYLIPAIAILLSGVLAYSVVQVIVDSTRKVHQVALKISKGELSKDMINNLDVKCKDELGEMAYAFKELVIYINEIAAVIEKVAAGDLTSQVSPKSLNDLLGNKLKEMIAKNNQILSNISSTAEQVASGSNQLANTSQVLSQGATEQSSTIEEMTATMEELATQTKQNALNANRANELAVLAKEGAVRGNQQMREMQKSMDQINQSSNDISKIIKVIDEIAFQTNILALNAAVEAARAGQYGKGFAVVAEEVRNLAARSASAAKENTTMIENSIKKVADGTAFSNETAKALDEIVEGIGKAASLVNEIAVASNEQATGIAQVSQAISQVSQVVQTNAASAEESAAASEELSGQATILKGLVSQYNLARGNFASGRVEDLPPEILMMLESALDKKKEQKQGLNELNPKEGTPAKIAISLEDNDFGKY